MSDISPDAADVVDPKADKEPVAEVPNADAAQDGTATGADAGDGGSNGAEPEPKADKPKRNYQQERFDRLTREREDFRVKAEAARAEAAAAREARTEAAPDATEAEIDRRMAAKLAERDATAAKERFAAETGRVLREGREKFADFDTARENFVALFGDRAPQSFFEAITELPNGAEVFREIGMDPDLADRILAMSPIKQAAELGRMSALKGKTPVTLSKTPAPIDPVRPGSAPTRTVYDTKISMDEWAALRKKEITARRNGAA